MWALAGKDIPLCLLAATCGSVDSSATGVTPTSVSHTATMFRLSFLTHSAYTEPRVGVAVEVTLSVGSPHGCRRPSHRVEGLDMTVSSLTPPDSTSRLA